MNKTPSLQKDKDSSDKATAHFPDAVLESITLSFPKEQIVVKGTVQRLTPYPAENPKWVYGDLFGMERTLNFRCPIGHAPTSEGEHVVLCGFLVISKSKRYQGLDVLLYGEKTGIWTPQPQLSTYSKLERTSGRMYLNRFLHRHGSSSLLIMSSQTGESDYMTAVRKYAVSQHWRKAQINFSDNYTILAGLEAALNEHQEEVKGLVFVRGGGDSSGLRPWDDKELVLAILSKGLPYYTAIGHSDKIMLADQWSDESFTTPTAFGDALGQILEEERKQKEIAAEFAVAQNRIAQLQKEAIEGFAVVQDRISRLKKAIRILATIAVILAATFAFVWIL